MGRPARRCLGRRCLGRGGRWEIEVRSAAFPGRADLTMKADGFELRLDVPSFAPTEAGTLCDTATSMHWGSITVIGPAREPSG